jgi:predicted transcriptional regulator
MVEGFDKVIIQRLLAGPATALELREALSTSEETILAALDKLRSAKMVQFMAGEWSVTESYKAAVAGDTGSEQ